MHEKTPAREPPSLWPLASAILLAIWLGLFNVIGNYTWGYGGLTFAMLVLVAALLVWGAPIARVLARLGTQVAVELLLVAALLGLLVQLGAGLREELERPRNQTWVIDIALNTYLAGTAFLEGKNPYAERAQTWGRIKPAPNVTVDEGGVRMFDVPYEYGFPYFPGLFLSYLPARAFVGGLHSLRVANALLIVINLLGMAWLTRRLVPPTMAAVAGLTAAVAYLGISVLQQELLRFAITDLVISTYALFGFVAASHQRWLVSGVLFGLVQACKLLPGPLVVLPVLLWLWGRSGCVKLLAGYVATSLVLVLPWLLQDPRLFLSSTVLFYLTHHAGGDNTSLWFFLPESARTSFRCLGIGLSLCCAGWAFVRRNDSLLTPLTLSFVSYVIFIAFNTMVHLNYLWGIYTLGCTALAAQGMGSSSWLSAMSADTGFRRVAGQVH
jgi:hypothetical protein